MASRTTFLLVCLAALLFLASPVAAFGAGNIASISKIEGHNWRHGDIEDLLKTVAFIRGMKWTSMQVKRTYFGNWLRDYSQAVDVGTLKGVQADTIRVLVWVLAFMSFGYATEEFEVTAERLGTYRPEEHIDNPKDYADNVDARTFDPRLRGPVAPVELAIDPDTGMKNYIANERGSWATSLGYIKWSFSRSIHFGRLYTSGSNKGRDEDLCEALRCLGQGLHCLEDFGAHTNYTELALRELGFNNVFPHVGTQTMINLNGKQVFPLVTGTFGGVDFLHSVLGEVTDHVTQTEVDQSEVDKLNAVLSQAQSSSGSGGQRGIDGGSGGNASSLFELLSQVPGTGDLVQEARDLQASSEREAAQQESYGGSSRGIGGGSYGGDSYGSYGGDEYGSSRATQSFQAPPGSTGGPPGPGIPGTNIDPQAVVKKIYPLLAFRDKVVRTISAIVSKIPGLEKMVDLITENVTLFIMGLLAPFVKPLIAAASNALKTGSGTVVSASQKQQYLVWDDPTSSDPTHSLLSKDHFSNILNEPAGQIAAAILQYVAPRVIHGWDHPEVPEHEILADVGRVFHHPAQRDHRCQLHNDMFSVVERWVQNRSDRGRELDRLLSSQSVRAGKNHVVPDLQSAVVGLEGKLQNMNGGGTASHSTTAGGPFSMFQNLAGGGGSGGGRRDLGGESRGGGYEQEASSGYAQEPAGDYSGSGQGYQQQGGYSSGGGYEQQGQGGYGGGGYGGGGYEQQGQGGYGQGGYGQGGYESNQGYGRNY